MSKQRCRVYFRPIGFALLIVCAAAVAPAVAQTARPSNAASPSTAVTTPVPDDYVIGPEDVLAVTFWREQEMSGDHTVRPDGKITLPLIGDILAAGLRPDALRQQLQTASQRYLTDANVSIAIKQINSRKVFITGEVAKPDAYPLVGPRTVMQIITLAGGVTEFAHPKDISVIRNEGGKQRFFKFNYKEVAAGKKLAQNIILQPGDQIVVP